MSNKHWEQNKDATIYVGNLDERFSEAFMWELMTQMGPVINVHMPMDRVSRTHQGYGFVEFDTAESADYASRCLNGIRVYGKPIRVNKASADKQRAADIGAELFINNLDPQVDEKILYDTFSQFGTLVAPPTVIRDQNNISKGYGFVNFDSFEASDAAKDAMNGQYVLSKQIAVEYAYKKDGKGERHGDEAERKLAAEGKKHNIVPEAATLPPAFLMTAPTSSSAAAPATPGTATPTGPGGPGGPGLDNQGAGVPPMPIPTGPGGPGGPGGPVPVAAAGIPPPIPAGFGNPMVPIPPGGPGRGMPPPGFPGMPIPAAMAAAGRNPLPPAPSGLPARPPPSHTGYGGPPPLGGPPGGFRGAGGPPPPMGAPPPPGFAPPPGFPGAPPGMPMGPPGGFIPPPGFGLPPPPQAPPAGFGRR